MQNLIVNNLSQKFATSNLANLKTHKMMRRCKLKRKILFRESKRLIWFFFKFTQSNIARIFFLGSLFGNHTMCELLKTCKFYCSIWLWTCHCYRSATFVSLHGFETFFMVKLLPIFFLRLILVLAIDDCLDRMHLRSSFERKDIWNVVRQ